MFKKGFFFHKLCIIIGFSLVIISVWGFLSYTGRIALFGGNTTNATTTTTTIKPETKSIASETTTTEETTTTKKTTSTSTTSTTTTTVSPADHVVFSEVLYDTLGEESDEEWIELYNPTSEDINISGLTIEDNAGSYTIPNEIMIASKDYLVIARNGTRFDELYEYPPDLSDLTLGLNDNGDQLKLKDGSDEIDMVAWEEGHEGAYPSWGLEADGGESIQRHPPEQDTDDEDDWVINEDPDPDTGGLITTTSTTTTAITTIVTTILPDTTPPTITIESPTDSTYYQNSVWINVTLDEEGSWCGVSLNGSANQSLTNSGDNWNLDLSVPSGGSNNVRIYCNDTAGNMGASEEVYFTIYTGLGSGDLVVTEIMINPQAVNDTDGEYVELYNIGTKTYDLQGLTLKDDGTDSHTISSSLLIVPDEYLVLCKNSTGENGGVTCDYEYASFTLANRNDEIILKQGATVIDEVRYDDGSGWSIPDGASLNLDPDAFDATSNDDSSNWCGSTTTFGDGDKGTPGISNDECS